MKRGLRHEILKDDEMPFLLRLKHICFAPDRPVDFMPAEQAAGKPARKIPARAEIVGNEIRPRQKIVQQVRQEKPVDDAETFVMHMVHRKLPADDIRAAFFQMQDDVRVKAFHTPFHGKAFEAGDRRIGQRIVISSGGLNFDDQRRAGLCKQRQDFFEERNFF